jgi:hypothetical protein
MKWILKGWDMKIFRLQISGVNSLQLKHKIVGLNHRQDVTC